METVSDLTKSLINSESGIISESEKFENELPGKEFHENELQETTEAKISAMAYDILNDCTIENNSGTEIVKEPQDESKDGWDDILGSGSLMKKILQQGTENTKPQRLDICTVNYTCILEDGTEVEYVKNGTVQMGDLEVVQGFDLALAMMNVGEICILKIEGRLAFGSHGVDNVVPPDATVLYEIELIKFEPEEEIETLTIAQRKQLGDKKRQRGNWWYRRGECTFAIQCFRRALDYLDEVEGGISEPKSENDDPVQRAMTDTALQDLMEDRINVSNNMAAAQMKLEAYDAALQSLQIVLRCKPNNVKALFRKSKILRAKNDFQESMKYLQKAKDLEPENRTIQKEIQELNLILQKHKTYEKELAKRMFNNIGDKSNSKFNTERKANTYMWASVALSVAVGIAGVVAWRFKFS